MLEQFAQTFRNACREARFVIAVWLIALLWTVSYCYLNGYDHDPGGWLVQSGVAEARPAALTQQRFGMPMWVCWGILAPAVGCSCVTFVFGLFGMKDDALGVDNEEGRP